jgi:serine/threonine protein kinase
MGDVYRATRRGTNDEFAVKVLRGDIADDPEIISRFLQERSVLIFLDDPSLVRVHDLVVEGGQAAIVMDLVDGGDLRQYLDARSRLSLDDAITKMATVFGALSVVHEAGVLHRDVKPENILLDESGATHLSDFGIARLIERPRMTQTAAMLGTPTYMAPEIGAGAEITPASDIYSAGVVLFELVTGQPPFVANNPMAMMRLHADAEPVLPSNLPTELREFFLTTLSKNPSARPNAQSAKQSLEELFARGIGTVGTFATNQDDSVAETIVKSRTTNKKTLSRNISGGASEQGAVAETIIKSRLTVDRDDLIGDSRTTPANLKVAAGVTANSPALLLPNQVEGKIVDSDGFEVPQTSRKDNFGSFSKRRPLFFAGTAVVIIVLLIVVVSLASGHKNTGASSDKRTVSLLTVTTNSEPTTTTSTLVSTTTSVPKKIAVKVVTTKHVTPVSVTTVKHKTPTKSKVPQPVVPNAVTGLRIQNGGLVANILWNPPTPDSSPVVSYRVGVQPVPHSNDCSGLATSCLIGVTQGTPYLVCVAAFNADNQHGPYTCIGFTAETTKI